MKSKIYAIIPARADSERIPNKNKKEFNGKPLVCWTIEEALKVKEINSVILSTNDCDIIDIGCNYQSQHPLRLKLHHRSDYYCEGNIVGWQVAERIAGVYGMENNDIIIYLQPTSPLRTATHIEGALYYFQINHCDSVISAVSFNRAYMGFRKDAQGYLEPLFYKSWLDMNVSSQDLPDIYIPNSAIYIITVEKLKKYHSLYTPLTRVYLMDKFRSVDLDTVEDWMYGEFVMKALQKKGEINGN